MTASRLAVHPRSKITSRPRESDVNTRARPLQAAWTSAASFGVGAALPLAVTALARGPYLLAAVAAATLVFLAALGAVSAQAGGAPRMRGALRVTLWGALAMAVTAGAGALFGAVA